MSNKRLRKLSGAVLGGLLIGGGVAGFGASKADASLTLDLTFANGSTGYTLTSADVGKTITMNVWATVTGAGTGNMGLGYAFFNLQSQNVNGGVAGGSLLGRIIPAGIFNNGSQSGVNQDINGDGIGDTGSSAVGALPDSSQIKPVAFPYQDPDTGDQSNAPVNWDISPLNGGTAVTNGYKWKIFTSSFKVVSLNSAPQSGAALKYNITLPGITTGSPPAAQWFEDSTDLAFPAGSTTNGVKTSGTGVEQIGTGVTFYTNVQPPSNSSVSLGSGSITGPTVVVTGSNHNYNTPAVLDITDSNKGSVNISSSPGNLSEGQIYVAAWLKEASGGQIAALITELKGQGVSILQSGDTGYAAIANMFTGTPGMGPIFVFNSLSTPNFNWDFSNDPGVTVDKLAVVPEPASIGLLGLGAVSLLARRRRRA